MKTYTEYLIKAYGLEKAEAILAPSFFFNKKTYKALRKYRPAYKKFMRKRTIK